jgi:hypothetical protein
MIIYLDAECALNALVGIGFIKQENWKRMNAENYTARFYHGSTNGTLCFDISVDSNVHKISALYIKNLERQYSRDLSVIVNKCTI